MSGPTKADLEEQLEFANTEAERWQSKATEAQENAEAYRLRYVNLDKEALAVSEVVAALEKLTSSSPGSYASATSSSAIRRVLDMVAARFGVGPDVRLTLEDMHRTLRALAEDRVTPEAQEELERYRQWVAAMPHPPRYGMSPNDQYR